MHFDHSAWCLQVSFDFPSKRFVVPAKFRRLRYRRKKSQNVDFFFEHTDAGGEQSIMGTPTSSIKHGDESKKGREHDFSIEM